MWRSDSSLRDFIKEQRAKHDGLPCEYVPIKESPKTEGYRNKCEFSVGKDVNNESVVGFRLGSYATGFTEVATVEGLKHISDRMKSAVKMFQVFVRKCANMEVFNAQKQAGHFRQLTARTSHDNDDLMLVVGINPQSLTEQEMEAFKTDLVEFFTKNEGSSINVASLYWQEMKKK